MESAYLGIRKTKLKDKEIESDMEELDLELKKLPIFKNNVRFPHKLTVELAEEIGIHIGDGHLSKNRYRYKIFGNINEAEYYEQFVSNLYYRLFDIKVNLTRRKDNTIGFEFSSKPIWFFKTNVLGLEAGRKEGVIVPKIIVNSNPIIWRAFIRGLFDTDGNVYFQSRYNYDKYYPVVSVASISKKLCEDVYQLLTLLGFKASIFHYTKVNASTVQLYGYENILKYAKEIGWHNKKHLNKFLDWTSRFPNLVNKAVAGI